MAIKINKKIVFIILGCIVFVVGALLIVRSYQYENSDKMYKSERMGIQFYYPTYLKLYNLSKEPKTKMLLEENGNRITIHPENVSEQLGQYVEIHEKNLDQSLKEAVETKFLLGKPAKWESQLKPGWDYAYPTEKGVDSMQSLEYKDTLGEGCPGKFTYFVMDRRYPDHYAEIYEGPDNAYLVAPTHTIRDWYDTIEFLKITQ